MMPSHQNNKRRIIVYTFLLLLGLLFLYCAKLFFLDIPLLRLANPGRTALMTYRDGEVHQDWVPLNRISRSLQRAVVHAEDAHFFEHSGIDLDAIRAAWEFNQKKGGYARGGSTITMQLAKNLFLTPRKFMLRKAIEIPLALKIDHDLSKNRILEIYLNVIEWGDGIYGAEAAAQHYFNKSAEDLTPREAAFLAAIIPNPRKWGRYPPGPYINRRMNTLLRTVD